jgi:hypothetical protein
VSIFFSVVSQQCPVAFLMPSPQEKGPRGPGLKEVPDIFIFYSQLRAQSHHIGDPSQKCYSHLFFLFVFVGEGVLLLFGWFWFLRQGLAILPRLTSNLWSSGLHLQSDYRYVPPCPANHSQTFIFIFAVLVIKARSWHMLCKPSTTELYPHPCIVLHIEQ